jgi:hypothetical protein
VAPATGLDHETFDPPARHPRARDRFFPEERTMSRFNAYDPMNNFQFKKFQRLGRVNNRWGVCGFTSACYALYARRQGTRDKLINATMYFSMLSTIKTFLRELQASGEFQLLRAIEEFNLDFANADFGEEFTIDRYLEKIDAAALARQGGDISIGNDNTFQLAMPPQAVVKYLQSWGLEAKVINVGIFSRDPGGNAIIGVKTPRATNPNLTKYNRLCHWMYRHNGRIYSWGQEFNSVKAADPDFEVCWVIQMREPSAPRAGVVNGEPFDW